MPSHSHEHPEAESVAVALLTISDTRTPDNDRSGQTMALMLEGAGHLVAGRVILPDDAERVRAWVAERLDDVHCDAILTSGGTGISARDRTFEAVAELLEQRLDGFGELFRALSYREIGSAAMLSRAVGGIASGKPVFCLPGSPAAVELALRSLILPELRHLISELRKHAS